MWLAPKEDNNSSFLYSGNFSAVGCIGRRIYKAVTNQMGQSKKWRKELKGKKFSKCNVCISREVENMPVVGDKGRKFHKGQDAECLSWWAEEFGFESIDDGEFLNVLKKRKTC